MIVKKVFFSITLLLFLSTATFAHTFKVLIFSKTEGFRHASIPIGISAIQQLGVENNFSVDATEDASIFTFSNLIQYDAIIFLSTTGNILNSAQQEAFEQYIQSGGGFVGIHAASDTEYDWPWYGKLVGAYFDSHPNNQTATIKVADKIHPSTKNLPEYWERFDEWYNYQSNPRGHVHVLATLDENSYNGGNMGYDHPIAWMHDFDGGRAWYTGGGHTEESYSEPLFLDHILGGILYATGEVTGNFDATNNNQYQVTVIDNNPTNPMALTVLPNLDVLYLERGGKMKLRSNSTGLISTAAEFDVDSGREDGLLGITLDPNFESNKWVYIFYSPKTVSEQRVSRFEFDGDILNMNSEIILLKIPTQREQCCHSGGDLEFDGNGNLFITTGDNVNPFEADGYAPIDERNGRSAFDAQGTSSNTNDLRGKILRIHPENDGSYTIPEGNLFINEDDGLAEIYVMGTRNPFRMAVSPKTGELVWGDVGPDARVNSSSRGPIGYDEFNKTNEPGNFGWPYCIADNKPYGYYNFATRVSNGLFDCVNPINTSPNNTGNDTLPAAKSAWISYPYGFTSERPEFGDEDARTAIAGGYFYYDSTLTETGSLPEYYNGSLFILEWTRNWIKEVRFDENGDIFQINPFLDSEPLVRPIDMHIGPNGAMYVIEWGTGFFEDNPDDRIIKIEFAQNLGNRAPIAIASASINSGLAPLEVSFTGELSRDPDIGDNLSYSWDFDNDGNEDANTANASYTYTENGNFLAILTVTDNDGESAIAQIEIIVGNSAPVVTIIKPLNGGFYEDFDTIEYEIDVVDAEQGTLGDGINCNDVVSEPSIGHDDHSHGTGPRNGCKGNFEAETHGEGPDNVFYILNANFEDDGAGLGTPLRGSDVVILNLKRKQGQHSLDLSDFQLEDTGDFLGGVKNVGYADQGDALKFGPMNFENIDFITLRFASQNIPADIEIRTDSKNGPLIATIGTEVTGGWQTYDYFTAPLSNLEGTHDMYVIFTSSFGNGGLGNINWIDFHGQGIALNNPDSLRGLAATYYSNNDFTGTKIVRKDPMIAFSYRDRPPHDNIPANGYSVRWEGDITPTSSGNYRFYTEPINGSAKVWLNDELIINTGNSQSNSINLQSGSSNSVVIEYVHNSGSSGMFFRWSGSTPINVVPTNQLVPDTDVLNVASEFYEETPLTFNLSQNYPNPFNPSTTINFDIPKSGMVQLSVVNTLRQTIQVLIDEIRNEGTHSINFDASPLSSGVYFYRLEFDGKSLVNKMILLK